MLLVSISFRLFHIAAIVRERALFALCLAPAAIIAGGFLATPNVKAATVPGSLIDAVMVAASLMVFAGMITIVLPVPAARVGLAVAAVAGLVVTLPVAALVAASILDGQFQFQSETTVWLAVASWSVIGAGATTASFVRLWEIGWSVGRAAAGLVAPAVILAVLSFWHQTAYLPANLEATVSVTPTLTLTETDTGNQGTVTVVFSNDGETGTRVVLSMLAICFHSDIRELDSVEVKGKKRCRKGARPLAEGAIVQAKGELLHRQVFPWPASAQLVQIRPRFAYARADKLRYGAVVTDLPKCISEAHELLPQSRYQSFLVPERILVYGPGEQGGVTYAVTDRDDPTCPAQDDDTLLAEYGIQEIAVGWSEWIDVTGHGASSSPDR